MALKSNNTAVAIAIQSVVDTFTTPTQPTDLIPVSNCRLDIAGVTIANDEYTGSPFRNADALAGKRVTLSYNVKLRPPSALPSANAFLLGRILQAAKFTEVRTATAIPSSAEAVAAGTTTSATLGAGAAATADLYKGLPITLSDNGSSYKERMSSIRAYSAGKVATLPETLGGAPAANYQIPVNLAYFRSISSADPIILSHHLWIDGHRFDLKNCRVSGMSIVVPTSTRDQAAFPELQVTFDAEISANSADATPSVTPLGAIPLFKDGDCWLAGKRIGSQTFTIDLGLQVENPPNPNKTDGVDAAELVGGTATLTMTRQKYLPSYLDTLALADAQAQHAFFAQWGASAGNVVQIVVPDARLNFPNPDLGGAIVLENGDLLIDAYDRGIGIVFPG